MVLITISWFPIDIKRTLSFDITTTSSGHAYDYDQVLRGLFTILWQHSLSVLKSLCDWDCAHSWDTQNNILFGTNSWRIYDKKFKVASTLHKQVEHGRISDYIGEKWMFYNKSRCVLITFWNISVKAYREDLINSFHNASVTSSRIRTNMPKIFCLQTQELMRHWPASTTRVCPTCSYYRQTTPLIHLGSSHNFS